MSLPTPPDLDIKNTRAGRGKITEETEMELLARLDRERDAHRLALAREKWTWAACGLVVLISWAASCVLVWKDPAHADRAWAVITTVLGAVLGYFVGKGTK